MRLLLSLALQHRHVGLSEFLLGFGVLRKGLALYTGGLRIHLLLSLGKGLNGGLLLLFFGQDSLDSGLKFGLTIFRGGLLLLLSIRLAVVALLVLLGC